MAVAGFSLLCISRNLRKYGLRNFVFVDKCSAYAAQFQLDYVREIDDFFRLLAVWVLPCLILKIAREIARVFYVGTDSLGISLLSVFILLLSWVYSATVYLSGSTLFSLVCNLQVIHFENYRKLLERDLGVLVYIEEHGRLTYHLSKISHRFRMFLILEFLIVTASQCVALLETTGNHDTINFINAADFAISSIVQLVGIIICLHAAAKISHRAQGLASFACKWHAIATCNSNETPLGTLDNGRHIDAANSVVPVIDYSESDLESADYVLPPTHMELASYMSSYHRRQAFVTYLQSNPGGVTIFGWTVDRALISTIFAIELSVVTFVLGKTISFSTRDT